MKKVILLACCVLAMNVSDATAQSMGGSREEMVVTKSEFSLKVAELNKLLNKGKTADAEVLFAEINKMANTELGITRDKMRNAQNEADKSKYSNMTVKQRTTFAQALNMKQENMTGNKQQIIEKLEEFAGMIE
jgi:hypothetical protein